MVAARAETANELAATISRRKIAPSSLGRACWKMTAAKSAAAKPPRKALTAANCGAEFARPTGTLEAA